MIKGPEAWHKMYLPQEVREHRVDELQVLILNQCEVSAII